MRKPAILLSTVSLARHPIRNPDLYKESRDKFVSQLRSWGLSSADSAAIAALALEFDCEFEQVEEALSRSVSQGKLQGGMDRVVRYFTWVCGTLPRMPGVVEPEPGEGLSEKARAWLATAASRKALGARKHAWVQGFVAQPQIELSLALEGSNTFRARWPVSA